MAEFRSDHHDFYQQRFHGLQIFKQDKFLLNTALNFKHHFGMNTHSSLLAFSLG